MTTSAMLVDGPRLARVFPFFLWLNAEDQVIDFGPSLAKAMPALARGDSMAEHFELRRPQRGAGVGWRHHAGQTCLLGARLQPDLALRGGCEVVDDGGTVLLVSPVVSSITQLRSMGLDFGDFAPHDGVAEMLLMAGSMQTSMSDAQRLAQRVRTRSQHLNTILELAQNGVLLLGADGRVLHANSALRNLLGLAPEALPGRTAADLDALLRELLAAGETWAPCFAQGAPQPGAAPAGSPDEDARIHRRTLRLARPVPRIVELSARHGADGSRAFYLHDVTARHELDRMKSEFLSTAAHELRTPMVSVFGFTELLLHRRLDDERRQEVLGTIHRQCERLIAMVNDLLDLARIEARQAQVLVPQPVSLVQLVMETVRAQHTDTRRHEVVVRADVVDRPLHLDPDQTARAISNVLSNAIKYSPDGGRITVEMLQGWIDGQSAVGVRVSDPGIGMSPDQLARVFERFYRADTSGNIPGTGLGMSLVKEIVELQGGRVEVASQLGAGTRVTLWFPAVRAEQAQAALPA
jgi:signal transduction histidine kinase